MYAIRSYYVPDKSVVNWTGEKVTGTHEGTVSLKSGWFELKNNKLAGGKVVIDMASIKNSYNFV